MLDICNNNVITMTRGDELIIPLRLFYNIDERLSHIAFFINKNDKVLFALCEPRQNFEDAIVKKVITYDEIEEYNKEKHSQGIVPIPFKGVDTEFLHTGNYYYTVKILRKSVWKDEQDSDGKLDTVISKTKFILID